MAKYIHPPMDIFNIYVDEPSLESNKILLIREPSIILSKQLSPTRAKVEAITPPAKTTTLSFRA